jgi:DNA-binding transcriptional MerR regulator
VSTSADNGDDRPPDSQGVYGIGVTSEMVGTGIQNLRAYERAGLLRPDRTDGGTRLYSPDDVARIRRIQVLLSRGVNLAGIAQVMELEDDNARLRDQLTALTTTDPDPDQPLQTEDGAENSPRSGA